MKKKHMQQFVKNYLKENLKPSDITVDATAGNGHDTLFLANISKFVYAFDIQELAINNTNKLLKENNLTNYKLINDTHLNILNYVNSFKCVVFNLGYLPNSDKVITTKIDVTIKTLKILTNVLNVGEFIIITCYPGHSEGLAEAKEVLKYASNLDSSFNVLQFRLLNKEGNPPFVVIIEKG